MYLKFKIKAELQVPAMCYTMYIIYRTAAAVYDSNLIHDTYMYFIIITFTVSFAVSYIAAFSCLNVK